MADMTKKQPLTRFLSLKSRLPLIALIKKKLVKQTWTSTILSSIWVLVNLLFEFLLQYRSTPEVALSVLVCLLI